VVVQCHGAVGGVKGAKEAAAVVQIKILGA
jgi:hypothetical protein